MEDFVTEFSLAGLTAIQLVRRRWEGAVGSTLSESTQYIAMVFFNETRTYK